MLPSFFRTSLPSLVCLREQSFCHLWRCWSASWSDATCLHAHNRSAHDFVKKTCLLSHDFPDFLHLGPYRGPRCCCSIEFFSSQDRTLHPGQTEAEGRGGSSLIPFDSPRSKVERHTQRCIACEKRLVSPALPSNDVSLINFGTLS